jgi:hypothetical protein
MSERDTECKNMVGGWDVKGWKKKTTIKPTQRSSHVVAAVAERRSPPPAPDFPSPHGPPAAVEAAIPFLHPLATVDPSTFGAAPVLPAWATT